MFEKPNGPSWWEIGAEVLGAAKDLYDIAVDLWDRNFGKDEPKVVDEPPPPSQIKPTQDNIIVIMPPPVTITEITQNNTYTKNININVTNIIFPQRILPNTINQPTGGGGGGSTNTQTTYTSEVKQSLANHKFGCMLMKPFYEKPIDWCEAQDYESFYSEIKQGMENDYNAVIEELTKDEPNPFLLSKVVSGFISTSALSDIKIMIGLKQFNAISKYYTERAFAVSELPVTGKFTNLGVAIKQCNVDTSFELPTDLLYSVNNDDNCDCGVPLELLESYGGKRPQQLQIFWRHTNYPEPKGLKQTTFVNAVDPDSLTKDAIKGALPGTFNFGHTLFKIKVKVDNSQWSGIAECRIFGNQTDKASQDSFVTGQFQQWIDTFCVNGETTIEEYTTKMFSEGNIDVDTGEYSPHRAVMMKWIDNRWCKIAHWLL
ncbi:hypothetical protein VKI21_06820 [Cyanobacterium aponinum UTEX 3222]|uniref:hypothetical protein n=1 Tax=Cyanobacterium aponinum TaxID=379064 RepID=UPI003084A9BC|nr:hypothetical protein VKI21_06820 [Cyanobacterium aponinum UTEX 3222]